MSPRLHRASTSNPPRLSRNELVRYGRHLVIPQVGPAGQRRLKASSVLIVGLGGLGTPVATYLAAAGIGRLGLVDGDHVETTNLHRQFLFSDRDIGKKKAPLARLRILSINPNVEVAAFPRRLNSSNAIGIINGFDVVVDCTDNLPSRYLVSDACVLLGKPDVYASVSGLEGQASVFWVGRGPCYRCLFPRPPPSYTVESCEEAGVLGAITGVMGAVQAMQVINLLIGSGSPLLGRLLVYNGLDSSFDEVRIKNDPRCPVCGVKPSIRKLINYEEFCGDTGHISEISVLELKESIAIGERPILLDVREPYEYRICRLKGSKLMPMGQLRQRMGELERGRKIVVYCHHGIRSARATKILQGSGYNAVNLAGGIEAWRQQVDPTMRSY